MSKLSQMYNLPPLDERQPVVRGFMAGLYLGLTTILSLPYRWLRIFLFLALTLPVAMKLPYTTTGDPARDYWLGTLFIGSVYRGFDYIVLTNADKEFYKVEGSRKYSKSEKNREKKKESRRRGIQTWSLVKWLWCVSVWVNNRGINCSWEVKNIGPKPRVGYPVWRFVLDMLFRTFILALLIDFIGNGYLFAYGRPSSFYTQPFWPNQILLAWMCLTHLWTHLDASYSVAALTTTVLGIYSPRDWPPLFGSISDSWTVRRFWGNTWHQMLRRPISTITTAVTRTLGFHKGSILSRYTQLYVGFFMSAAMHAFGGIMAAHQDVGNFRFFILQPFAITAEDIVIAITKKLGYRGGRLAKVMGYLWVIAWLTWSLRSWAAGKISVGTYRLPGMVPYSFAAWFGIRNGPNGRKID